MLVVESRVEGIVWERQGADQVFCPVELRNLMDSGDAVTDQEMTES